MKFAAGADKPRAVVRPDLFGSAIPLPQPGLFGLESLVGEGGWLKALRLEDYAPRRPQNGPLDGCAPSGQNVCCHRCVTCWAEPPYTPCPAQPRKRRGITGRKNVVPAMIAVAALVACLAALLAASQGAEAAFPGQNGRMVFGAREPVAGANYQIFTINPDGTGTRQLTDASSPANNTDPAFSPGGTRIAWVKNSGTRYSDVGVMNADGTGKRNLASRAEQPAFSPDGKKVVFAREDPDPGNYDTEIYWRALDGTGGRRVTENLDEEDAPAWSPAGRKIAFAHQEFLPDPTGGHLPAEVATVNPDGTGLKRLTALPRSKYAVTVDWAPKGGGHNLHGR